MAKDNNGLVAGLDLGTTFSVAMLMCAFLSIALFSVIELTIRVFFTFKSWRGLYFWSLLVATWGIAFNCLGYILKFFQVTTLNYLSCTLIIIGWTCMVTGQSVVLYSRLHLVLHNHAKVRGVLILIITNFFVCHVPVTVLVYGANSSHPKPFVKPYKIYECVQLTIFALQEVLISSLYIYYTTKIIAPAFEIRGRTRRKVMVHLIYVNAALIILDVAVLGLQYAGLYDIQTSLKPAVYAIKLKLEFHILNHLFQVMQTSGQDSHNNVRVNGRTSLSLTPKGKNSAPTYTSFVNGDSINLVEMQGQGVMRTREVIVESEDCRSERSLSEGGNAAESKEKDSPSSSQVELARAPF